MKLTGISLTQAKFLENKTQMKGKKHAQKHFEVQLWVNGETCIYTMP